MDDELLIKIQTLDNLFSITMKRNSTVNDLKEKINEMFNIPIINQRLIFQGKNLQSNTEKLKHYKITNESVIHLVVRKTTFSDDNNTINTNSNNQNTINNLNSNLNEENNLNNSQNNNIPFLSFNRRNNMRHFRQKNIHFDISDCIENLYQNIITISNIIKCKNKFNYTQILQSKTIKPFNLNKRKFEIGEWVDVKDTIDNWLEAQIINIRTINNKTQILVHYSGWGNRWDEWIDIKSSRIANFKTYTLQSQNSIFLSPYPSVNVDGFFNNNFGDQHRPIDVFFYFDKVSYIMNDINKSIDYMNKLRKKGFGGNSNINKNEDNFSVNNEDKEDINTNSNNNNNFLNLNNFIPFSINETEILMITSQIIPILDRCGRLMSDLSLLLSHLIFNPNLYPHLLFGRNNNELSDSISCTSGYSMYTNESNSIYSGITGHRFMQERDNNININNNLTGLNRNNQNSNINTSNNNININSNNNNNINTNNSINNMNTNNTNNNNNNTFSHPRYYINSSSSELPFIQRLNFSNNLHQNGNLLNPFDFFPKINLQIPPLLSPNEINMVNAYNPLDEQNIFLIGRNVLIDNSNNNITMNQAPNHNFISNSNNQNNINLNNLNMNNSENNIIAEMNNTKSNDNISEGDHFKNLNYTFNKNFTHIHRAGSVTSNRSTRSAEQMYTREYKIFKYENDQNDVNLNLLKNSLNKDNNYNENYMESLSLKSDKNLSIKNKNLSYKSVSEVDEFGEYDQEDEEKKKDNITITSHRSLESGYMKEFLDNDDNNSNISNNNSINTNSVNISSNTFNINTFNPNNNK